MKAFTYTFKEGLLKGLRRFALHPRNEQTLVECHNAMPCEEGLRPHKVVHSLDSDTILGDGTWDVFSWPFPQVRFLDQYVIGFARSGTDLLLCELTYDGSDIWTSTSVYNLGSASNIDQIEVADLGPFYMMSVSGKPVDTVIIESYIRNPTAVGDKITKLPNDYIPKHLAMCNYNGQFLIGGIIPGVAASFGDLDLHTVAWSQIGRIEFRIDNSVTRTAGYTNMPWKGQDVGIVYKLAKLGKSVMVYGDGGRLALIPYSQPVSGYGQQLLSRGGVRSGNHVDGDDLIHGFIDINYDWWTIDGSLKATKWGYREFMKDLVENGATRVSFEPIERRFYISNGVKGFVFTEQGLYSTHQLVSSIGNHLGILSGFFEDSEDTEYRIVSDTLDFGLRGLKTVETMEIGIDAPDHVFGAVDYRYDKTGTFTRSPWNRTNKQGGVGIIKTAPEFRLGVKADDYEDVNLDYMDLSVKISDKRMLRRKYNIKEK